MNSPKRPPAPQLPTPDYVGKASTFGQTMWFHARRAWNWNLQEVVLTPGEKVALEARGIRDVASQRYYAWRRSSLGAALFPLAIAALFALRDLADLDTTNSTALGRLVSVVPSLLLLMLPIVIAVGLANWSRLESSQRVVTGGWAIATVTPILLALLPVSWLIESDLVGEERQQGFFLSGVFAAIGYAITLIPTVVSIPSGVLQGCLRVKALLPESVLPGWFLIAVAPFYSLMTLVAFIVIEQIAGSALLILGVGLFAFAPLTQVIHWRAYVEPTGDNTNLELVKSQRYGSLMSLGALVCIVIWAFTAKINGVHLVGFDDAVFKPWDIVLRVLEYISRSLVTTVVFAHIFLAFNQRFWAHNRRFLGTTASDLYDETMEKLSESGASR